MTWRKFLILGDSISQFGFSEDGGWVCRVANLLQRKCDIVNRGFSGYNTDNIRVMMPSLMKELQGQEICGATILLGSNDSVTSDGIQHVPVAQYTENLSYIVDYLIKSTGLSSNKIILITLPKKDDLEWAEALKSLAPGQPSFHFDRNVTDYVNAVKHVAESKGTLVADMNARMQSLGDEYKSFLCDGLHLSKTGSQLLFDILEPLISNHIMNGLKDYYPDWKDLKKGQSQIDQ